MTKDRAKQKVIALARKEIGYHEQGNNNTKYAEYLDSFAGFYNGPKNGYAWCDVFFDYLFVKCFGVDIGRRMICQPLNSAGAGCLYSAQYYQQAGRFFHSPEVGDQIFFTFASGEVSHTGIVESIAGNTVITIEGNTSDGVYQRSYALGSGTIYGYGRPDWALTESLPDDEQETVSGDAEFPQNESQAEKPAASFWPPRMLREGMTGADVAVLQALLIAQGYDCKWIDGEFGNRTKAMVMAFQGENGLETDGIAGPITFKALGVNV